MDDITTAAVEGLLIRIEDLEARVKKQDECIDLLVDHLAETRAQVLQLIEDQPARTASAKDIGNFMSRASVQTLLNNMPESASFARSAHGKAKGGGS